MPRVLVYPEGRYEQLGAERWQASWEEVRPEAVGKDDIDPYSNIVYCFANYATASAALQKARTVVDSYKTAYGGASVVRQIVGWFVEEDRVAEWQNAGEVTIVD